MTDTMKQELNYKIQVEPAIFTIINRVAADCEAFGVSKEDIHRAIWAWADMKLAEYETPPQWLWLELEARRQQKEALNTIDGEVERS
jgi:hypothetical protein